MNRGPGLFRCRQDAGNGLHQRRRAVTFRQEPAPPTVDELSRGLLGIIAAGENDDRSRALATDSPEHFLLVHHVDHQTLQDGREPGYSMRDSQSR